MFSVVNKYNLDRDFFRYLWYCGKKQIECRSAWHWWNYSDLGLCINRHFFYHSECKNCCLYIIIQKIALQAQSETCFQICFFPPIFFWGVGGMAAFWACACKLLWTLFSPARVQPLYGAGRKESSGTGLPCIVTTFLSFYRLAKGSLQLFICLEWQEAWLAEWFIFRRWILYTV